MSPYWRRQLMLDPDEDSQPGSGTALATKKEPLRPTVVEIVIRIQPIIAPQESSEADWINSGRHF
jgi:hypothetical protein